MGIISLFPSTSYPYLPSSIEIIPITSTEYGQCYGDMIHFQVSRDDESKFYAIMDVSEWVELLPSPQHYIPNPDTGDPVLVDQLFFFVWSSSFGKTGNTIIRGANRLSVHDGGAHSSFKKSGVPIFVSTLDPNSQSILEKFPADEVDRGYVMGLVDRGWDNVYDMTQNMSFYISSGSFTLWDMRSYILFSDVVSSTSATVLDEAGAKEFYRDLYNGHIYLTQLRKNNSDTTDTIQSPYVTNFTYTASFSNEVVYSYFTNKTVVVDPYIKSLNSILKLTYPRYATEGDTLWYKLSRSGILTDPLTVHVITNGYWHSNVTWEGGVGGDKWIQIKTGIDDDFSDGTPFEVLIKTINRKVSPEL